MEKATVGLVYAGINFNMEIWREEADFALAMKHLLQIGETQPILLALSPVLLEEQNLKQYVYTLWREGPPQYRFGQFSAAHFDGNDFREPI